MRKFPALKVPVLAALLSFMILSPASAAVPLDRELAFTVQRNGDEIGRHVISFHQAEDQLTVDISTHIAVKLAFITVYHFDHEGHEIWRDGRLVRLTSRTDDDGENHSLDVTSASGDLVVNGDGAPSQARGDIIPASLWNPGILRGGQILNTLTGRKMAVETEDQGMENVTVHGQPVPTRHYVLKGDLERELWFDSDNQLVKVRFNGKDGSVIDYVLK